MLKLLTFLLLVNIIKSDRINIECKYGLENYGDIKNINRCFVQSIDPVRYENMDINVINIHTGNNDNNNPRNIHGLEAKQKPIFFFPGKVGKHFPNLKALQIVGSNLRNISSGDFEFLSNLEFLDLSQNYLLILDTNLFNNTQKLRIINLKDNRIYFINPNAFFGLVNLTNLDLNDNTCYSIRLYTIQQALMISNLNLCKEELLHSCGAFTQALNLAYSQASSSFNIFNNFTKSPEFQNQEVNFFDMMRNNTDMFIKYNNKIIEHFNNVNTKLINNYENVQQVNQACQIVFENITKKVDLMIVDYKNIYSNMIQKMEKLDKDLSAKFNGLSTVKVNTDKSLDDCNETFPNHEFMKEKLSNILKTLNDKKCETSDNSLFNITVISLLSCVIFLLIIILVILLVMCLNKSASSSDNNHKTKKDVKVNDEYDFPYISQNQYKGTENHYQVSNIVCREVAIAEPEQWNYESQQQYEEIPENAYNKSRTYERTVNNADDDFYEENPSLDENSDVNYKRPIDSYAAVYRPVKVGMIVHKDEDNMLYS